MESRRISHELARVLQALWFLLVSGVCLWGIVESLCSLSQVLGWRSSRHALYALTGHFQNPGPFGGFIACVMAVAGSWLLMPGHNKCAFRSNPQPKRQGLSRFWPESWPSPRRMALLALSALAWLTLATGFLVLPASMSRAGWLGLVMALGIESLRLAKVRDWMHAHRWAVPATIFASILLLVGAFILKPDSALGRLHVWRMECRAIAERPWTGAGPGMGPWAYGEAQEAFFREHLGTVSPAVVRVAGCPEYAFNEFLGLGVEYGVPALLLSVLLVVSSILVLHRTNSPLAAGLTAWSVFACASYPMSVPQLRILGAIFIVSGIISGLMMIPNKGVAGLLAVLTLGTTGWIGFTDRGRQMAGKGERITDVREVYAEGYALHQAGRYEESTKVLEKGAMLSCDPMFEIIMGKNAEALGDFDRAEVLYEKAHYMVPSRLYPMVRLMRLQIRQESDEAALKTAREIVSMPVNDRNAGMTRLHKETQVTLDSLASILRTDG